MNEKIFKDRTKKLALRVIQLTETLPHTRAADVIAKQIIRSATSVGANYRAACRAKSTADMIVKLKIVEEESDETIYWLELLLESKSLQYSEVNEIMKEAEEVLAMTVASIKTLRVRLPNRKS